MKDLRRFVCKIDHAHGKVSASAREAWLNRVASRPEFTSVHLRASPFGQGFSAFTSQNRERHGGLMS